MKLRSLVEAAKASPDLAFAWLLGAFFCALRYVGLDHAPPAFFSDEFRAALHHICIAELGMSAYGERWPLFIMGAGRGLYTPPYLYIGALWVKLFGPTIVSCRALSATFTLAATIGTALVARRVAGGRVACWAFLAASLSPWAFQFARIAWDPPMAPAFLIWAVYFWLGRARLSQLIGAGIMFGLALHAYPPTRIQAPLTMVVLGSWALYRRSFKVSQVAIFSAVGALVAFPVLRGTIAGGALNERGLGEAIFNPAWVERVRGIYGKTFFLVQAIADHIDAHFRPTFLFFTGDRIYRHSTQYFGVLGLLDDLALGVVIAVVLRRLLRSAGNASAGADTPAGPAPPAYATYAAASGHATPQASGLLPAEWRLLGFGCLGYFMGILPAALCWAGVPHSLRSIGAYPFLALATGVVIHAASRSIRHFSKAALAVACGHALLFGHIFFVSYPEVPKVRDWFDGHVNDVMMDPNFDPERSRAFIRHNPEGYRYYSIAYRGETCASSDALYRKYVGIK